MTIVIVAFCEDPKGKAVKYYRRMLELAQREIVERKPRVISTRIILA